MRCIDQHTSTRNRIQSFTLPQQSKSRVHLAEDGVGPATRRRRYFGQTYSEDSAHSRPPSVLPHPLSVVPRKQTSSLISRRSKHFCFAKKNGGECSSFSSTQSSTHFRMSEAWQRSSAARRTATLLALGLAAVVLIMSVSSRTRSDSPVRLLATPVRPRLSAECSGCLSSILRENPPWARAPSFDPKTAMLCVSSSCHYASLGAPLATTTQQLTALPGAAKWGASVRSKISAAMTREQDKLDVEQLELNWQRARIFSQFVGPPAKAGHRMVLAEFVPPLDPRGRPVPSWLKFTPAGAPGQTGLFGTGGAWDPETKPKFDPYCVTPWCSPSSTHLTAVLTNNTMCYAHDSCSSCLSGGCAWCHGSSVCGTSCPVLPNVQMYTKLGSCPSPATLQAQEQEEDAKEINDLRVMSAKSEVGPELVKNISFEEQKAVNASDVEIEARHFTFYPLARTLSLQDEGAKGVSHREASPSLAKAVAKAAALAAAHDAGKISLAAMLAPLNVAQERLNAKRQMLFFRTETGIATGREPDEIYSHTIGGGGEWDNWAKPTTTWSLVGRPAPGWLHWGNDNDGGYFNPVGGSEWDPQMLNPANNKGTWGPATDRYRERHPHPEDEGPATMANSPLFGA